MSGEFAGVVKYLFNLLDRPRFVPHSRPAILAQSLAQGANQSTMVCVRCMLSRMSLRHPPPGFPLHLALIWPLIWVQVLVLRAAVRAAYGKGTQYHWSVSPCGRAFITSIDWVPGQTEAPVWLKPAAHSNVRLAVALDGSAVVPAYARLKPLLLWACAGKRTHCVRLSKGLRMRGNGVSASSARADRPWPLTPTPLPRERGLPPPES